MKYLFVLILSVSLGAFAKSRSCSEFSGTFARSYDHHELTLIQTGCDQGDSVAIMDNNNSTPRLPFDGTLIPDQVNHYYDSVYSVSLLGDSRFVMRWWSPEFLFRCDPLSYKWCARETTFQMTSADELSITTIIKNFQDEVIQTQNTVKYTRVH